MKHVKLFEQFISEKESIINEGTFNNAREIAIYDGEDGLTYIEKRGKGYYGWNDEFDFTADSKAELEKKLKSWKYRLISGSIDESILNEYTNYNFKPANPSSKDIKGAEKWLKKYMTRTAKTTDEATKRIESFAGGAMFTHVQYHIVKPNGNKPDRPTFRLHQSQEWLNDANLRGREEVNATLLSIYQLKDGEDWNSSQGDAYEKIGQIYVDSKEFLNELGVVFQTIKRSM